MTIEDVRGRAFAMPLTSPAYPRGPYRFVDREYFTITYRTDREALEKVVPAPLAFDEPLVQFEFIRMPDATGFGDYTESGQIIPVRFKGDSGAYSHAMYLDDGAPLLGGRELWGFPKKYARPTLGVASDALIGALDYGPCRVATGVMGFKHRALDAGEIARAFAKPNYLLKIIPHVDGSPRILELVDYRLEDVTIKGAWSGPASLELHSHALAPVADLPVREIVSAVHILADLTLGLGKVVHDYLAPGG
jgi:acetoacetate decarboxylase